MDFSSKQMCRSCMCKNKTMYSIYEFSINIPNLRIVEMLLKIVPNLLIEVTDELPKTLCESCLNEIVNMHKFQEMCIASDIYMRNILKNREEGVKLSQMVQIANISANAMEDPLRENYCSTGIEFCLKVELNETDILLPDTLNDSELKHNKLLNRKTRKKNVKNITNLNIYCEKDSSTSDSSDNDKSSKNECQNRSLQFDSDEKEQVHNDKQNLSENIYECIRDHQKESNTKNKNYTKCYKCECCSNRFLKKSSLTNHMKTHMELESSELYKFICEHCTKKFKSQRCLIKHKRIDHPKLKDTRMIYDCKYCNKVFQQSSTLKDHLRTHTGEQPFLCSECGKAFSNSSNMKQHLLRHTGEKRYECPNCPKKFPCLSDLASHKAVHKKIKPHICDICGAAFGKPFQLKKHKMYHNGEKPHKCEYCEMRFVIADHMRRHMRTHTGEKPYKCKYCERAFTQSNDLIKHLRSHLGENVYKCELCPKAFRLAAELREHFADHKNDDEETRNKNLESLMADEEKLRTKILNKI